MRPTSEGINRFFSRCVYPRSTSVEIIFAYVEGLPMPYSSSVLTRLASEYRGGGCVKCCSPNNLFNVNSSFSSSSGNFDSFSLVASSAPSR